ncbi:MAG: 4-hydroxythreonine-4-phosphate dehydrogenase PdxA [Deltaproteobacteria bacterium]|nr:4-hydroxythreonine-4-phosphate dehydrogenase PdxA [Deltaproteobacteria bacterium]
MGDPVGIGPEIIVKALAGSQIYQVCRPYVLGDFPALERARLELSPAANIHLAERPGLGRYKPGTIDLMPLSELKPEDLEYGRPTKNSGKAMVSYILKAIELAQEQIVAGMVTGPISKFSMNLSGYHYPGHTELLADKTGTLEVAMMLAGSKFRVVLATIHCALAEVPGRLSTEGLLRLFHLVCRALEQDFGLAGAPLAVAALNPHAGEGGMFGREEEEIIIPAIRQARAAGLPVEGPFPADTLFWRHRQGEFAAVVCMYHDQGLIPLKLLHFIDGVNVTLGLPIIRTSVDHGTAYDLAGTGRAAPDSLKAAIIMAAAMAKRRFGAG